MEQSAEEQSAGSVWVGVFGPLREGLEKQVTCLSRPLPEWFERQVASLPGNTCLPIRVTYEIDGLTRNPG